MAFLRVVTDIYFRWEGDPPRYRTWVNNELFGERTWYWQDEYAEELFQVEAPPGQYQIRIENLQPDRAKIKSSNLRVEYGPGRVIDKNTIEVYDESQ